MPRSLWHRYVVSDMFMHIHTYIRTKNGKCIFIHKANGNTWLKAWNPPGVAFLARRHVHYGMHQCTHTHTHTHTSTHTHTASGERCSQSSHQRGQLAEFSARAGRDCTAHPCSSRSCSTASVHDTIHFSGMCVHVSVCMYLDMYEHVWFIQCS